MNLEGIVHRCAYTDFYARNENELVINLRTNKEITAVNLIHEDSIFFNKNHAILYGFVGRNIAMFMLIISIRE